MSLPPSTWPPPYESVPNRTPASDHATTWVVILGTASFAGSFFLLPALWMLGICAYGRGHTVLFLAAGIALIGLVLFLGAVAWVLGKEALTTGATTPFQASRIRTGRICGLIGAAIAAAFLLFIAGLLIHAHGIIDNKQ